MYSTLPPARTLPCPPAATSCRRRQNVEPAPAPTPEPAPALTVAQRLNRAIVSPIVEPPLVSRLPQGGRCECLLPSGARRHLSWWQRCCAAARCDHTHLACLSLFSAPSCPATLQRYVRVGSGDNVYRGWLARVLTIEPELLKNIPGLRLDQLSDTLVGASWWGEERRVGLQAASGCCCWSVPGMVVTVDLHSRCAPAPALPCFTGASPAPADRRGGGAPAAGEGGGAAGARGQRMGRAAGRAASRHEQPDLQCGRCGDAGLVCAVVC